MLSERVRRARQTGTFPLTIAGNCGSALGTVSGVRNGDIGIIWLDAHGDFNTPETTTSGFADGMSLAMLTGVCWKRLTPSIPGFAAIPAKHVVHVGARALEDGEEDRTREAGIAVVDAATIADHGVRTALDVPLTAIAEQVRDVYLHLDLDVLNPEEVPANNFQPAGGMSVSEIEETVRFIGQRFNISAAAITAYELSCDPENRATHAVSRVIRDLIEARHALP